MTPDQQAFEAAVYAHYQQRHAAGDTTDSHAPIGSPEHLLWKEADGTYGVLVNNAAWWGWQAAKVWEPEFDAMSVEQEKLVWEFCVEIAGKRGEKGSAPDPVRLLEMAQSLYLSERNERKI